jgi:hypothetical protein
MIEAVRVASPDNCVLGTFEVATGGFTAPP